MSAMQAEVFEAFRAIDVPEDKAFLAMTALTTDLVATRREIASLKDTVVTLETHIHLLKQEIRLFGPQLAEAKSSLTAASADIMALKIGFVRAQAESALPKWMMSLVIGSLVAYSLHLVLR